MEFAGPGTPLSAGGIATVLGRLDVEAAALWAVIRVETGGVGGRADRRPQILFERHVVHREPRAACARTAPDICSLPAGGYGAFGGHQYERLSTAMSCDRRAALRSGSWGIGQIMGFHAEALRYGDVETMVREMVASEDAQLLAMAGFITLTGLDNALRRLDWAAFAREYNGAEFARNGYDAKLAFEYRALVDTGLPDLRIRAAQVCLTYRSLDPGPIDGLNGDRTRKAIERFQHTCALPVTGDLDDVTLGQLTQPLGNDDLTP